jgi:endonuclease III
VVVPVEIGPGIPWGVTMTTAATMNRMKKPIENLTDTVLADDSSAEQVRDAFHSLGQAVQRSQKSLQEKREKIERDITRGARTGKHRFHL